MLVDSSLFRACKQTRAEGLSMFYQYHTFILSVRHVDCFMAILRWLQNIGSVGRDNIRHLIISFETKCDWMDKRLIDYVHENLTEKAEVVYIGRTAESIWAIGWDFIYGDAAIVPVCMVNSKALGSKWWVINFDFSDHPLSTKLWTYYSMAFYPGQGWFGPKPSHA